MLAIGVAILCVGLAMFSLGLLLPSRKVLATPRGYVVAYRARIAGPRGQGRAGARLVLELDYSDGRTVLAELDGMFAYELSAVMLDAAAKLGTKRSGVREGDPDTFQPRPPHGVGRPS